MAEGPFGRGRGSSSIRFQNFGRYRSINSITRKKKLVLNRLKPLRKKQPTKKKSSYHHQSKAGKSSRKASQGSEPGSSEESLSSSSSIPKPNHNWACRRRSARKRRTPTIPKTPPQPSADLSTTIKETPIFSFFLFNPTGGRL